MLTVTVNPKPFVLQSETNWNPKWEGVILVEKEEDIDLLYNLLLAQDEYWKSYKKLIQVMPENITSEDEIISLCDYCGKTDIYLIDEIQAKVNFFIYQYRQNY